MDGLWPGTYPGFWEMVLSHVCILLRRKTHNSLQYPSGSIRGKCVHWFTSSLHPVRGKHVFSCTSSLHPIRGKLVSWHISCLWSFHPHVIKHIWCRWVTGTCLGEWKHMAGYLPQARASSTSGTMCPWTRGLEIRGIFGSWISKA